MSSSSRPALRIDTGNSPPTDPVEAEDESSLRDNDDTPADYLRFINLLSGRNVPIIRMSDLVELNSAVNLQQCLTINERTSIGTPNAKEIPCRWKSKQKVSAKVPIEPHDQKPFAAFLKDIIFETEILSHPLVSGNLNVLNLSAVAFATDKDVDEDLPPWQKDPILVSDAASTKYPNLERYLCAPETSRPIPLPLVYEWIHDIASGLMALHNIGLVHGSLKLSSIYLYQEAKRFVAKVGNVGQSVRNPELRYGNRRWWPDRSERRLEDDIIAFRHICRCLALNDVTLTNDGLGSDELKKSVEQVYAGKSWSQEPLEFIFQLLDNDELEKGKVLRTVVKFIEDFTNRQLFQTMFLMNSPENVDQITLVGVRPERPSPEKMHTKDKDENKVLSNLLSCYPKLPWFVRRNLIRQLETTIHKTDDISKFPRQIVATYALLRYLCPTLVSLSKTIPSWDGTADDCEAPVIEEMDADKTLTEALVDAIPRAPYGPLPIPEELQISPLHSDISDFSNFTSTTVPGQSANQAYSSLKRFRSPKGFNYLHVAVALGGVETIDPLAELVNESNSDGWTPLHEAVYRGKIDSAKELIRLGARETLNQKATIGGYQLTPLAVSVILNLKEMAVYLLSENADTSIKDERNNGMTVFHYAVLYTSDANILTQLSFRQLTRITTKIDTEPAFKEHLRNNTPQDSNGSTPLHLAVATGNALAFTISIVLGNVDIQDNNGMTALHYAIWEIYDPCRNKETNVQHANRVMIARILRHLLSGGSQAKDNLCDNYGLTAYRRAFLLYLVPKLNGIRPKFGSPLKSWVGAKTGCSEAWHIIKSGEKKGDNMMILKPTMGVITIERTFKNISTTDYVWGFYVVSRMARTSFLDSKVTIRCTVTTTRSEALLDNKYAKVFIPERSISMRFCILEENAEELMPRVNTAYVLRLGEVIPLKAGEMYNVRVKLEVECENNALNTGLILYWVKLENVCSPRITRQSRFIEEEIPIDNIMEIVYPITRIKPIQCAGPGMLSRAFAEFLLNNEITLDTVIACFSAIGNFVSSKKGPWYVQHGLQLVSIRLCFRLYKYLRWWLFGELSFVVSLVTGLRVCVDSLFISLLRWFGFSLAFVGVAFLYPLSKEVGEVVKWSIVDGVIVLGLFVLSQILYQTEEEGAEDEE